MKLIRQKGNTCFIASLAMCLGVKVDEIVAIIGHDGQERVSDRFVGNKGLRGVHPQELLDVCRAYGRWLVTVECYPTIGQPGSHCLDVYGEPQKRFSRIIKNEKGILATGTHAVAFDHDVVYDPHGKIGLVDDYEIQAAWIVL